MGHRAACRVGSSKSARVPRRRPGFTWPPFFTLAGPASTHRARRRLSSSSNSNNAARRPSRAAQDMARGCAAAGWQQVTATNTGPQDPQHSSPKGPHSRGPAGKRVMEREEREGKRRGRWEKCWIDPSVARHLLWASIENAAKNSPPLAHHHLKVH